MKRAFVVCLWLLLSSGPAGPLGSIADDGCRREGPEGAVANADAEANRRAIKAWRDLRRRHGRKDPIFRGADMYAPLLFAHRGGALETTESTVRGFRYALEVAGADVLELDVQITRDGRFVVWHGPGLKNVFILGVDPDPEKRPAGRRLIHEFDWHELDGKAWVADRDTVDLGRVPRCTDRQLLLLADFMRLFKTAPLNVEMKRSFKMALGGRKGLMENVAAFRDILRGADHRRTVVVASASHEIIAAFRSLDPVGGVMGGRARFPTNLSPGEQIKLKVTRPPLMDRALETSYSRLFSSAGLIRKVRDLNGATYVFITRFGPIRGLDRHLDDEPLFEVLDRGVDGIMTDRPGAVREAMHRWLKRKLDRSRGDAPISG